MQDRILQSGRAAALNAARSKLADIKIIAESCSPRLYDQFHFLNSYLAFTHSASDDHINGTLYFDLVSWTNAAWRFLASADVEKLDESQKWRGFVRSFQGLGIGLALRPHSQEPSLKVNFSCGTELKIFGCRKWIVSSQKVVDQEPTCLSLPFKIEAESDTNLELREVPGAAGISVTLEPYLADMVGQVGYDAAISRDDVPYVAEKLEASLRIIDFDPENRELVANYVGAIVPLENPNHDEHQSLSIEATPGVIYIGKNCDLPVFAEAMVHEADHQRLYEIRKSKPLTVEVSSKRFCSPWRPDPRPAGGLVFGASAFLRVSRFWSRLLTSDYDVEDVLAARYRSVFTAKQTIVALDTLVESEELTEFGREYCRQLGIDTKRQLEKLSEFSESAALIQKADKEISSHIAEWRQRNETVQVS